MTTMLKAGLLLLIIKDNIYVESLSRSMVTLFGPPCDSNPLLVYGRFGIDVKWRVFLFFQKEREELFILLLLEKKVVIPFNQW